jgi:nucleoside-diphosphate-sugar epimerase
MARQAFVVGGTGQVGRAVARRLVEAGWSVTVASRGRYPNPIDPRDEVRVVRLDRGRPGALADALSPGADVLIDLIAYDAGDARQHSRSPTGSAH